MVANIDPNCDWTIDPDMVFVHLFLWFQFLFYFQFYFIGGEEVAKAEGRHEETGKWMVLGCMM